MTSNQIREYCSCVYSEVYDKAKGELNKSIKAKADKVSD